MRVHPDHCKLDRNDVPGTKRWRSEILPFDVLRMMKLLLRPLVVDNNKFDSCSKSQGENYRGQRGIFGGWFDVAVGSRWVSCWFWNRRGV